MISTQHRWLSDFSPCLGPGAPTYISAQPPVSSATRASHLSRLLKNHFVLIYWCFLIFDLNYFEVELKKKQFILISGLHWVQEPCCLFWRQFILMRSSVRPGRNAAMQPSHKAVTRSVKSRVTLNESIIWIYHNIFRCHSRTVRLFWWTYQTNRRRSGASKRILESAWRYFKKCFIIIVPKSLLISDL